jgi:hypothetical protein
MELLCLECWKAHYSTTKVCAALFPATQTVSLQPRSSGMLPGIVGGTLVRRQDACAALAIYAFLLKGASLDYLSQDDGRRRQ